VTRRGATRRSLALRGATWLALTVLRYGAGGVRPAGSIGAARGFHRRGRETRHWRTQSLNWAPVSWTRRRHMLAPRAQNRRRLEGCQRAAGGSATGGAQGAAAPGWQRYGTAQGSALRGLGTARARHREGSAPRGLGTARVAPQRARHRKGRGARVAAPQGRGTARARYSLGMTALGRRPAHPTSAPDPGTAHNGVDPAAPGGSWVQPSNAY